MTWHVVGPVAELPPGSRKLVRLAGREIGVFNQGGAFYALLNRCPHQGGALCRGTLVGLVEAEAPGEYRYSRAGEVLKCPWHGWEFDLRTGRSRCDPEQVHARAFAVGVAPGSEVMERELVAETFPVSVQDDYVIVEV
jgi:3-phenylpropionate/trans-cinnamate dioxygenase ferredoxin subunit